MLKQRVITGLLLLLILGGSTLLMPMTGFVALILFVSVIAAWEWANLAGFQGRAARLMYALAFLLGMCLVMLMVKIFSTVDTPLVQKILGFAGVWWAIALLWVQSYPASAALWGSRPVRALIGVLVLLPTFLAFVYLRQLEAGVALVFYVVFVVAFADIGAYFAGRAFGRRKLAPRVSPGKSWAGVLGGLLAVALFVCVVAMQLGDLPYWPNLSTTELIAISLFTALTSVLGDLLESMLKRERGIKDSSKLLPGHGGVLDRLDGLTAAVPIFTLCFILLGQS